MDLGLVFFYEMIGTFALVLIGLGVNATATLKNTHAKANNFNWLYISFGWAVGIMVGAFFAQYSGGAINPAVGLGLLINGTWTAAEFGVGMAGELVGALLAAYIIIGIFWKRMKLEEDKSTLVGIFATGESLGKENRYWTDNITNLLVEIVGTFLLVFFVLLPSVVGSTTIYASPIMAGLVVFGIGASIGSVTGFAINPARDLMPRLAIWTMSITSYKGDETVKVDWTYSWVPIVGPFAGGAFAAGIIALL